jgi:hypothetical protein
VHSRRMLYSSLASVGAVQQSFQIRAVAVRTAKTLSSFCSYQLPCWFHSLLPNIDREIRPHTSIL